MGARWWHKMTSDKKNIELSTFYIFWTIYIKKKLL